MARTRDRRVERTGQLLRGALVALIREKGYEALTVQEIIDRANVGRATCYSHFDNKDDLLVSVFEVLRAALTARQREAFARGRTLEERVFGFSREVFAHANEHRDVFRAMVGKRSGAVVERVLHKLLIELLREDVTGVAGRPRRPDVRAEALVQFLAGALFGLLMWWIDGNEKLSEAEIDAMFRGMALPAFTAATKGGARANQRRA